VKIIKKNPILSKTGNLKSLKLKAICTIYLKGINLTFLIKIISASRKKIVKIAK